MGHEVCWYYANCGRNFWWKVRAIPDFQEPRVLQACTRPEQWKGRLRRRLKTTRSWTWWSAIPEFLPSLPFSTAYTISRVLVSFGRSLFGLPILFLKRLALTHLSLFSLLCLPPRTPSSNLHSGLWFAACVSILFNLDLKPLRIIQRSMILFIYWLSYHWCSTMLSIEKSGVGCRFLGSVGVVSLGRPNWRGRSKSLLPLRISVT